ncbi:uncharacterized protein BX664DRAFT_335956 [Halteromyces radiatus]|uniref:uncharacterized protein n=1 Tax=Halteromyces radiatus TaxID=101107 RepID=UPI00222076BD|nr:uncharacterized protein BX664DRAFT_335956 [Halteromyces radiatus]KAI8086496.1 hypothetical protein BX664DRAFT_335956 [Halteromyces radiatus]
MILSASSLFILVMVMMMSVYGAPIESRGISSCYKHAILTFYWIPKEGDKDMLNDGQTVTLNGPKTKTLKGSNGKTIAKVSKTTYEKFQMEGTGLLKDGKMVNLGDSKTRFQTVNRKTDPYGVGSNENSLVPWVSVASNDLHRGTKLYIKELDGIKLPDGKTHNGCVRVDDQGWSFGKCQLDFFTLQFSAYKILDNKIPGHVTVSQKKDCKILNYVTSEVKAWAELT